MPITAHFGEVFGGLTPKCSRISSRPPKGTFWPETLLLAYRSCRSVKTCDLGASWRKQKKKKKKKRNPEMWQVTYICPDHPRWATPTKVVMWCGIPDIVNHAKFHQNWFRGFGSLRGRNLPFSYAWCYGLYTRLGLPPNTWLFTNDATIMPL